MPGPDKGNTNNHIIFHLTDGSVLSTRDLRFSDVDLDLITKIEVKMKRVTHVLDKTTLSATFLEFIHYRTSGRIQRLLRDGTTENVPLYTWTVGWRDVNGIEHLDEFDFKTGQHIDRRVVTSDPLNGKSHYHPRALIRAGVGGP